jgi:hypothetical protein
MAARLQRLPLDPAFAGATITVAMLCGADQLIAQLAYRGAVERQGNRDTDFRHNPGLLRKRSLSFE